MEALLKEILEKFLYERDVRQNRDPGILELIAKVEAALLEKKEIHKTEQQHLREKLNLLQDLGFAIGTIEGATIGWDIPEELKTKLQDALIKLRSNDHTGK